MPGLVGTTLDSYRLVDQIGQGGMSTVYRAVDTRTQQEVAVKALAPTISSDKRFVRRFRREAGLLFRLRHPNIVPVTDYGEAKGVVYLVMPLVLGDTLHDRLTQQKLSVPDLSRWIGQVSDALQFAHDQGVIHRDIKPANVMISRTGNALLTDFGLARLVEGSHSLTGSMLMGTPAYVSPEQGRGQLLDARSDQYALGVILYQIAAGRLPFEGDSPMGTVLMHIQEPLPPLRRFNKDASPALERVIGKAMAKDPEERFPNVAALYAAYQTALMGGGEAEGQATQVIPAPRREAVGRVHSPRRSGSRLGWALIGVLGVAVLGLGAAVAWPALKGNASEAISPPSVTAPAAAPVTAPVAAVPPSPEPTLVPTAIVSQTCPKLQLIGFERDGARAAWTIDNATGAELYLEGIPVLRWEDRNPLTEVQMGGQTILPPSGFSISGDAAFSIPRDERTHIADQSGKDFTLLFTWPEIDPLLRVDLVFTGGCTLSVP
jgi:serine/threonine-protein kinase